MKSTKLVILSILLSFISTSTIGQKKTFVGYPILKTQAEVNTFGANNYTHINGWMRIEGEDITSLESLSSLRNIKYSLWITKNNNLESLKGLSNIDSIGVADTSSDLYISENNNLKNLNGLESLKEVNFIRIIENPRLKNIDSLKNISSKLDKINISKNDSLISILGLQNISEVSDYLYLKENKNLISLNGLDKLTKIGGTLTIQENVSLINLNPLSNIEVAGSLWITLNDKLSDFCGLNKLFQSQLTSSFSMNTGGNLYNPNEDDLKNGRCSPQIVYTNIPDNNFEQALIDLGLDDVIDNKVKTSNINTLTNLNIASKEISDLTGLEDFVGLTFLNCAWNKFSEINVTKNINLTILKCEGSTLLKSLDLTKNTALKYLNCYQNAITNLDITQNTDLENLLCSVNQLTSLDISQNKNLKTINCGSNKLSTIDLTNNTKLTNLDCNSNQITSLDISNNLLLTTLGAYSNSLQSIDVTKHISLSNLRVETNKLTSLDITKNTNLEYLGCSNNQLESLNVTLNNNLQNLSCYSNSLKNLNVSLNTNLISLNCQYNKLTRLNVKNGNNTNFTSFYGGNNSNLTCIEVDNASWSTTNWTNIDTQTSFNESCATYVPDDNFEQALIDLGYDDILDDYVLTSNINSITSLDIGLKNINDLTGIEKFVGLTTLKCWENNLTKLDVSKNVLLETLLCSTNKLNELDITNNPKLKTLNSSSNNISSLDISGNLDLEILYNWNTQISNLDISLNTQISTLDCRNNYNLTTLNLKNNNNTKLINPNLTNTPNLTCVFVDNATYSKNNWTELDATATFLETQTECDALYTNIPDDNFEQALINLGFDNVLDDKIRTSNINTITKLDVDGAKKSESEKITDLTGIEDFIRLEELTCWNNSITSINITNNTKLKKFHIGGGALGSLDVSKNILLEELFCSNNNLSQLDINNNTKLKLLSCSNNNLSSLDVSNNPELFYLQSNNNLLNNIDLSNLELLVFLNLSDNQLLSINISNNLSLSTIYFNNNKLTELDISKHKKIFRFSGFGNNLRSLNVKNTNNTNFIIFNVLNNEDLTCIYVDDASYSKDNWTDIDETATYIETQAECDVLSINNEIFENLDVLIFPNPTSKFFTIKTEEKISKVIIYNLLGKELSTYKNTKKINLINTAKGIYFAHIFSINGEKSIIKIIKK